MTDEKEIIESALLAGHILLENGAEISRVEETINRICRHFGVHSENAFVLSNGIFVTAGDREEGYFAKVEYIPVGGTRLDRIARVNELSRNIEDGRCSLGEIRGILEEIRSMPEKRFLSRAAASGVGSAAFCGIFGGSGKDMAVALCVGFILCAFMDALRRWRLSRLVSNICGGAFAALLCILFLAAGLGEHLNTTIVGAIMPLIPGVAFVNAIRDLVEGDYISGSVRMQDAMVIFFGVAIGMGMALATAGIQSGGASAAQEGSLLFSTAKALVGTVAFSLLFGVPRQYYPLCGLTGSTGWLVYSLTVPHKGEWLACLLAAMAVVFLARLAAVGWRCPATMFLIPGIFPLVPGKGIYWTTYYIVTDQLSLALQTGYGALKAAVAIVLGIAVLSEVRQGLFRELAGRLKLSSWGDLYRK